MELKTNVEYQGVAVAKLVKSFKELVVAERPNATMIFKSPTGSGKTVMMAMALDKIREEDLPFDFVYLWASMGDLAHQSYIKMSNQYLPDSEFNMLELENITDSPLQTNTILFCNWEKMFKTKNVVDDDGAIVEIFDNHYVKLGESGRNLQNVLELTRRENKKIVLIVDEAHHTYLGTNSQKLVNRVIKPDLTIEISATPIIKLPDGYYEENVGRYVPVYLQDVIDSGLIKKKTVINNNITGVIDSNSADTAVLAAALKQQRVLAQKYKDSGTNINPLILVQLPSEGDKTSTADESMLELVERYMYEQGITYENGKLAVWMSGNYHPSDVKTATVPNDSTIEVLIFKQAIATGWDCPRASIIVMLRDIQSIVFQIQTVGRILRMPELKHYEDEDLNNAYVFTNIDDMAIAEDDDTKSFFNLYKSKRIDDFTDSFIWPNIYRKRIVGQRHRLNQNFRKIVFPILDREFKIDIMDDLETRYQKVDELLEIDASELKISILSDVAFTNLDNIDKTIFKDDAHRAKIKADEAFIERTFNYFLKAAVSPYAPHDSSRILKSILYKWFSENGFDDECEVQRIVACSKANQNVLLDIIQKAKDEFSITLDKETELTKNGFSIPLEQEFGDGYERFPAHKHVLQPYYRSKSIWDTEKKFEAAIDDSYNVEWWYRNGESEPKYFGIPYKKTDANGKEIDAIFYADYIVKFTDGTYGIFDTKSGDTARPTTAMGEAVDKKANALQTFLRDYAQVAEKYSAYKIHTTECNALWGGLVNVKPNGTFWLQADAVTQNMARKRMNGESVTVPSVGYDGTQWKALII